MTNPQTAVKEKFDGGGEVEQGAGEGTEINSNPV
jgi:hypothetical protein